MRKAAFALAAVMLGPVFLGVSCHGTHQAPLPQPPERPLADPQPVPNNQPTQSTYDQQAQAQRANFSQTEPTTGPTDAQLSAMAFPCTTDANCLTNRCNTALGRCAWPCQSDADCQPNTQCIKPACIPIVGQQPAQK